MRRFAEFTGGWPWQWRSEQLDAWVASGGWAHSTIRSYQGAVALFLDYVCDARYGWVARRAAGRGAASDLPRVEHRHPCGRARGPPRAPSVDSGRVQVLFDVADVVLAASSRRKGWLAAFRDATLFKVIYGWGLRRREAAMLDVGDFSVNPAAPELGRLGVCQVRYGKAMKGSPPRRRAVASVMPWAVEGLEQYLDEVRPCYGCGRTGVVAVRAGRADLARRIDERFAAWRAGPGCRVELSVHCLRHSYVSHLIEDGVDPLFVQHQVGHSWASTTAVYTSVGSDAETACCGPRWTGRSGKGTLQRGARKVGYRWHLRWLMAERGMFATSDLGPLLAERGVVLSREQVYRLVAGVPERLSLATLAALCDILGCQPGELIEPVRVAGRQADAGAAGRAAASPAAGPGRCPAQARRAVTRAGRCPAGDELAPERAAACPALPPGAA